MKIAHTIKKCSRALIVVSFLGVFGTAPVRSESGTAEDGAGVSPIQLDNGSLREYALKKSGFKQGDLKANVESLPSAPFQAKSKTLWSNTSVEPITLDIASLKEKALEDWEAGRSYGHWGELELPYGSAVSTCYCTTSAMEVRNRLIRIYVPMYTVVFFFGSDKGFGLYNIASISRRSWLGPIVVGDNSFQLRPGQALFVSDKRDATFAEVNPANRLLFRGVSGQTTPQGTRIFLAEFRVASMLLHTRPILQAIAQSGQSKSYSENLSETLQKQGQEDSSKGFFSYPGLSKSTETSRGKNCDAGVVLNRLAVLCAREGKYSEAEPLCNRSWHILAKELGPNHLSVAGALENDAELLRKTDRKAEADEMEVKAKAAREAASTPIRP